jgi:two-component system LytT family response regulator
MQPLRTLIVDDEELARENLRMLLEEFCPEIEVIGTAGNVKQAREKIEELSPQVVFLDIRMPSGAEGFQLLKEIPNKQFMVVFATAFKDYAIKAFNANAVHYILKPIDIDDLQAAVQKLVEAQEKMTANPENFTDYLETIQHLSDTMLQQKQNQRITINHAKGFKVIEDDDIVHLIADSNCTELHFNDSTKYLDTRTLKVYEDMLNESKFFRVHKSHIVNLHYVREYLSEDGHVAVLKNGARVPIARNRLSTFITAVHNL